MNSIWAVNLSAKAEAFCCRTLDLEAEPPLSVVVLWVLLPPCVLQTIYLSSLLDNICPFLC
jgi:hypothetical protein